MKTQKVQRHHQRLAQRYMRGGRATMTVGAQNTTKKYGFIGHRSQVPPKARRDTYDTMHRVMASLGPREVGTELLRAPLSSLAHSGRRCEAGRSAI
jgi:hypothetical protein